MFVELDSDLVVNVSEDVVVVYENLSNALKFLVNQRLGRAVFDRSVNVCRAGDPSWCQGGSNSKGARPEGAHQGTGARALYLM